MTIAVKRLPRPNAPAATKAVVALALILLLVDMIEWTRLI